MYFYVDNFKVGQFKHLAVAPFYIRKTFVSLINKEIANAKAGKKSGIILKMNSLVDREMIVKLYEASNAGVPVQLIVRGACSLVTGIEGYSKNIVASLFTICASTVVISLAPTPSSQTVVTRSAPTSVGVKENKANLISLSVYPNPSSSQITLAAENNKANTVEINDVAGKMISVYVFDNNKVNFSTLEMTSGIDFYTVKNNSKQIIATGKFTVTH